MYQSFSNQCYFLNVYTPSVFTNNNHSPDRIQTMLKFLSDDAPLLDLELQSPPICSKGIPAMHRYQHLEHRRRLRRLQQPNAHQGLLPPGTLFPPQQSPTVSAHASSSSSSTSVPSNSSALGSNNTKKSIANGAAHQNTIPPPYTVMMHITTRPDQGPAFARWFRSNIFVPIIKTDNTVWNYAFHASSANHTHDFWIYQTHASERDFLDHVQTIYASTSSALSLPWWAQNNTNNSHSDRSPLVTTLSDGFQRYLKKPIEYVALSPTSIQLGMHTMVSNQGGKHSPHKAFSPLHSIQHPP